MISLLLLPMVQLITLSKPGVGKLQPACVLQEHNKFYVGLQSPTHCNSVNRCKDLCVYVTPFPINLTSCYALTQASGSLCPTLPMSKHWISVNLHTDLGVCVRVCKLTYESRHLCVNGISFLCFTIKISQD